MSTKTDRAISCFNKGFNCAQAVFAVFSDKNSLNEDIALKLTSGLGGGFFTGEVCGAVSGAVLAIGLKHGQYCADDIVGKKVCYAKTKEFIDIFRGINGAVNCRDILGCDIATTAGREKIKQENLLKNICEEKIKSSVRILLMLGY